MATRVVHCKKEPFDIMIDRHTIFGNPFVIGKDGTREEVCYKHLSWLAEWFLNRKEITIGKFSNKIVFENLHLIKDKNIACWCKPKQCHGDTLAKLADELV
jgi:hypothetical protein